MRKNITIFLSNNLIVYLFINAFKKLKYATIILNSIINIKILKIKTNIFHALFIYLFIFLMVDVAAFTL